MILGAVAGAIGAVPLGLLGGGALQLLPWVLVAYFLFVALRPGRRLPLSLIHIFLGPEAQLLRDDAAAPPR